MKRWKSILRLKCPRCSQGDLFLKKGLLVYTDMLDMHEHCSQCDLKYNLEPGFWLGSLWTSYPIVILIEIPFLFLAILAEGQIVWLWFAMMILSLAISFPIMLRLGRSIWIHINVRGEEEAIDETLK